MKAYIISIIGATILSAVASILTPDAMRKYVSVITGFIIISVIISPLSKSGRVDFFAPLREVSPTAENYGEIYARSVADELKKQIERDIENRIEQEFGTKAYAEVTLDVEGGDIKRIRTIALRGTLLRKDIAMRLGEVYGVNEVIMDGQRISF